MAQGKESFHMVAEHIAPTVARSRGSDARASGATAAADGSDPTAAATADAAAERQQQTQQPQRAPQTTGIERRSQQQHLNMKEFDNIETLSKSEDTWQIWSWKIKTGVSGMNEDLAELLSAAKTGGVRNAEDILKDDEFVANRQVDEGQSRNVPCVGEVHDL